MNRRLVIYIGISIAALVANVIGLADDPAGFAHRFVDCAIAIGAYHAASAVHRWARRG